MTQGALDMPAPRRNGKPKPKPQLTEQDLLAMLRRRHAEEHGNGEAWAFIPSVRDAAGFSAKRTIDAIAMSLWPSRGLRLHAFEIKCSRGDWLRELKHPEKADHFCHLVDFFWLVVADDDIVRDGELPETWGLLVAKGRKLHQKVAAPLLGEPHEGRKFSPLPEPFGRSFLAALLRNACRQGAAEPAAIAAAREEGREHANADLSWRAQRDHDELEKLRTRTRAFEQASGLNLASLTWGVRDPKEVGAAVRAVLDGDHRGDEIEQRLHRLKDQALAIAETVDQHLAHLNPDQTFGKVSEAAF